MTSQHFHQHYINLIAFFGGFYCLWYLIPSQITDEQVFPMILLALFIGLLGCSPLPAIELNQALVLGGNLTFGPQVTAAATFLGVLLFGIHQWSNPKNKVREGSKSFPHNIFFQIGILLIPMALATETLNWQPNPFYDISWYDLSFQKAIAFSLLFLVSHTILRAASLMWYEPFSQIPARYSLPIVAGSELIVLPNVYLSTLIFSYNESTAIFILGGSNLLLYLTLYFTFTAGGRQKIGS